MTQDKKDSGMIWLLLVMMVSLFIAYQWENFPVLKETVGKVLDPWLGKLLQYNVYLGFIFFMALMAFILTLSQKYLTDQEQLRELKKEQKYLQEEMKKYKEHPEKLLEFQKKQFELIPKTMNLTTKPLMYTSIPVILLFRWFSDHLYPIFGGWWIVWYLIGSMIFSSIFRKVLKVV